MNGLQPATIRSCKRIRCLPLGTILPQRLGLPQERVRWYRVPGDPTTIASSKPDIQIIRYPTCRVLADVQPTPPRAAVARRVLGDDETVRPSPHVAVPLNSEITNLTPISIERREAPIRRLLQAIDRRQDVAIWRYFSFVAAIMMLRLSASDFTSILHSLRPRRYISLRSRHYLDDNHEARLTSSSCSYEEFRRRLQVITKGMQASGHSLGISEYTHLLDCARAGGDTEMAEQLWNQMAQDGITPDTWAYNTYMAAVCGTASTNREQRLSDHNLTLRTKNSENARDTALAIYKRMMERGVTPNSMTFDILMLAVARMGDFTAIYRTLKEIWGVDVAALSNPETPESMQPLMKPDSPLYPSPHTLTAVAAVFGSNNDIETAIRIIDHLTRRYNIPITIPAWITLLNWTYVFTRPPATLPKFSVINLWHIMTSAPYKIKPTLEMYDYLVRSLIGRQMLPDAETMINRGLKVFARQIARATTASTALEAALNGFPQNNATYDVMHDLRRDVALARREEYRGRSIIKRWVELLCLGKGMRPEHARIRVPNVVRKMRYFLGGTLVYVTPTGYVELMLGGRESWRAMSIRRRKRAWTPLGTGAKEVDYLD